MTSLQQKRLWMALSNLEQAVRVLEEIALKLPGNPSLMLAWKQAQLAAHNLRSVLREEGEAKHE